MYNMYFRIKNNYQNLCIKNFIHMTICASGCQHGLRCHFLMHAFQWLPHELELTLRTRVVESYTLPSQYNSENGLKYNTYHAKMEGKSDIRTHFCRRQWCPASPAYVAYLFRPVHGPKRRPVNLGTENMNFATHYEHLKRFARNRQPELNTSCLGFAHLPPQAPLSRGSKKVSICISLSQ